MKNTECDQAENSNNSEYESAKETPWVEQLPTEYVKSYKE